MERSLLSSCLESVSVDGFPVVKYVIFFLAFWTRLTLLTLTAADLRSDLKSPDRGQFVTEEQIWLQFINKPEGGK